MTGTAAFSRLCATVALVVFACSSGGCSWLSQTRNQHGGTTALLIGLSAQETADQHATTLDCARATISWAAQEGSKLIMAPVGLPEKEQWPAVDFALHTSAQKSNPVAARHWREKQSKKAEEDLAQIQAKAAPAGSADVLASATGTSRLLNYQHGPRTLVLCTSAQQSSPELKLTPKAMSHHAIEVKLAQLQPKLEPMRLTRVVFGAAGDAEQKNQSLTEQAAYEAWWRAWAKHESAIHFSYGPVPHFPYP